MTDNEWRKSSFCGSSACVQVAETEDTILIRNTTQPDAVMNVPKADWAVFIEDIANGKYEMIK